MRNGVLEDLDQHAVGPPEGTVREAGSTIQPSKSGRTQYTEEDDCILVKWVMDMERNGGSTKGNEIYKQLEAKVGGHVQFGYSTLTLQRSRILGIPGSHGGIVGSRLYGSGPDPPISLKTHLEPQQVKTE